jgi:molybdopterin synthase sulfur carrier subunit
MSEVKVLFFASLRDEIGISETSVSAKSLSDLIEKLEKQLGKDKINALTAENVRIAVDQKIIEGEYDFVGSEEVAFLPPVTGG